MLKKQQQEMFMAKFNMTNFDNHFFTIYKDSFATIPLTINE